MLIPKHDLRPILTCCTRNSMTQKPFAPATWIFELVKNWFFGAKISKITEILNLL